MHLKKCTPLSLTGTDKRFQTRHDTTFFFQTTSNLSDSLTCKCGARLKESHNYILSRPHGPPHVPPIDVLSLIPNMVYILCSTFSFNYQKLYFDQQTIFNATLLLQCFAQLWIQASNSYNVVAINWFKFAWKSIARAAQIASL